MKRKTFLLLSLLLVVSIMAVGCGTAAEPAAEPAAEEAAGEEAATTEEEVLTLKLGFAGALTGGSAEQGTRQNAAMTLAVEQYNAARGPEDPIVEIVAYDDMADPKEAATVANKLASDTDVVAVIGHTNSSCTLAGAPIYETAGLVDITTGSSSPKISEAGPYIFRTWNSDVYTAKYNVTALLDMGCENIGIIYENNDYGLGGYNVAVQTLEDAGKEPVVAEAILLGETKDFSTIVTKMKNAGVDGVYAVADETELGLFASQSAAQNYEPKITSAGTYSDVVIEIGGEAANGMYGTTPFNASNLPPKVSEFFESFWERFADEGLTTTDSSSPPAYIGTQVLLDAIRAGNYDRESIKDYLTGLTWESIVGTLTFDENGDVNMPLSLMVIENGEFVDSGYAPEE